MRANRKTLWDIYADGEYNGMWQGTVRATTRSKAIQAAIAKYQIEPVLVWSRNEKKLTTLANKP